MPGKHAVLIGINKYPHYGADTQLSGCVNDAKLMKSVLTNHFNFDAADIQELHDEAATRDAILGAMDRLVQVAKNDDIVVFHYSGHGRQRLAKLRKNTELRPTDGDWFDRAEVSGYDSTLMPSDTGPRPHPHLDITDNTIHDWLERLAEKTRYITLIFDACHSGTITRDAFGATERTGPAEDRPLEESGIDAIGATVPESTPSKKKGKSGWLALSDRYVVMSGCEDMEKSKEMDIVDGGEFDRNGVLTYYLTNALMRAKPGSTYRDVFEVARQNVSTKFKTQHPQIEGSVDREIFGVRDIEPLRSIPITSVDGELVTLNGGAAHGLRRQSLWEVYPQGTKQTTGVSALGLIEIQAVNALTATAVIRESTGELAPGARCVEKAPANRRNNLRIDLSAVPNDVVASLSEKIEQSILLNVAENPREADIKVYVVEPREQASIDDAIPNVTRIDARSWALVDLEANLSMPLHAVEEEGVVDTLIHNLEASARYRNALRLDNPATELDAQFNIYRRTPNLELELANGGDFVFNEGDFIAFDIVNRDTKPVWFCVLDFDVDGTISQLYPPPGSPSIRIEAGKTVTVGKDREDISLGLSDAIADQGVETYKAFITNKQANFEWQVQDGFRSGGSGDSAVENQLKAASAGAKPKTTVADGEDWTAIGRSFIVQRRSSS